MGAGGECVGRMLQVRFEDGETAARVCLASNSEALEARAAVLEVRLSALEAHAAAALGQLGRRELQPEECLTALEWGVLGEAPLPFFNFIEEPLVTGEGDPLKAAAGLLGWLMQHAQSVAY